MYEYEIEIANDQETHPLDLDRLRTVVRETLQTERVMQACISVVVVDDPQIHELNREFLNHDYETDVLSFLLEQSQLRDPTDDEARLRAAGQRIEGEVVISADTAARMAADFDWSPEDEVVLYLVHGLLHLCGYDDLSESEQSLMRTREREILKRWNLFPRYAEETCETAVDGADPHRQES